MVLYFGNSEQFGSAYYAFKQKIQIFEIMEPTAPKKNIYLCDKENSGPKSGNLAVNFLMQYVFAIRPTVAIVEFLILLFVPLLPCTGRLNGKFAKWA